MGEKCMTETVMEDDEGNGFERHWKVGMKMGSGCVHELVRESEMNW